MCMLNSHKRKNQQQKVNAPFNWLLVALMVITVALYTTLVSTALSRDLRNSVRPYVGSKQLAK